MILKINIYLYYCVASLAFTLVELRKLEFFRRDYYYFEELNSFYKVHITSSLSPPFLICEKEGAQLYYPTQENERSQIFEFVKVNYDAFIELQVGLHNMFQGADLITFDGNATPSPLNLDVNSIVGISCVTIDIENLKYSTKMDCSDLPFICKKEDKKYCPTIDSEYKLQRNSDKCYKIHELEATWEEAFNTCYNEGGKMLVIDNKFQYNSIKTMLKYNQEYFIGFRKIIDGNFYTIKGQRLQDSVMADLNRNSIDNNNQDECGVIIFNGNDLSLRANNCFKKLSYICEMNVF